MNRMKSGALLLGLFALAACTDTVGPDTIEDTLTDDVAMILANAVIDGFGDLGLLFGGGRRSGVRRPVHPERNAHRHVLRRERSRAGRSGPAHDRVDAPRDRIDPRVLS